MERRKKLPRTLHKHTQKKNEKRKMVRMTLWQKGRTRYMIVRVERGHGSYTFFFWGKLFMWMWDDDIVRTEKNQHCEANWARPRWKFVMSEAEKFFINNITSWLEDGAKYLWRCRCCQSLLIYDEDYFVRSLEQPWPMTFIWVIPARKVARSLHKTFQLGSEWFLSSSGA